MSKNLIFPYVYTMIMFGISICLWIVLPQIPIMPETPVYLQHPLFMLELFSLLSTVIVWIMAMLISLYILVIQKMPIIRCASRNLFLVSLVSITIVVAVSGSLFFSKTIPYRPNKLNDLWVDYFDPPDLFGQLYGFGILFCEGAWLVYAMFHAHLRRFRKRIQT